MPELDWPTRPNSARRVYAHELLDQLDAETRQFPAESLQEHQRVRAAVAELRAAVDCFPFAEPVGPEQLGEFTIIAPNGQAVIGGRRHPQGSAGLATERDKETTR